ncbi:MAG TPA: zf-HC2 domain-containing protein [Thermoanaerobaculia bacterium]
MTEPVAMTTCPTDETLAAFIDGLLTDDARMRVIEHMAECGDCRDIAVAHTEFEAIERMSSGGTVSRFSPRMWFGIAATLAAAAVLLVVFGPMLKERLGPPSEIRELADASQTLSTRPLEGRLSGDFAHQPVYSAKRGDEQPVDGEALEKYASLRVDLIVGQLTEKASARATPANLHALGVAQLYHHEFREGLASLTAAILADTGEKDLQSAIKESRDVKLLTDLSVALQHRTMNDKLDAANSRLALEAATAAWTLEKTPETTWNRAVALERVGQREAAINAWNDYLKLDSTSRWATEALDKIKELNAPPEF